MKRYTGHREAEPNEARLVESEYNRADTMNISSWGPGVVLRAD